MKIGPDGVRQCLQAGVNDLGGTLMDENISRAAGAATARRWTEAASGRMVEPLGRPARAAHDALPGAGDRARCAAWPVPPSPAPPVPSSPPRSRARRPLATTGDEAIDTHIADLLAEAGATDDLDLLFEILVAVVQLASEGADRPDLKITNAALKEMRNAFRVFAPYRDAPKVTIFGSARTRAEDPLYDQARTMARVLADEGWMVVTGAGPGDHGGRHGGRGAGALLRRHHPAAVRAAAPTPSSPATTSSSTMKYFFTRKLMLVKESAGLRGAARRLRHARRDLRAADADADRQGRARPRSCCSTSPGGTYWRECQRFVDAELVGRGLVSPDDLELYLVTDDVAAARHEITALLRRTSTRCATSATGW